MIATPGGAARDVKEAGVAAAVVAGTGGATLEDMAVTVGARTTTVRVSASASASGTEIASATAMSAGAATGNASVAAVVTESADEVIAMTAGTASGTAGATGTGRTTRRAGAQRGARGKTTIDHLPGLTTGRQHELSPQSRSQRKTSLTPSDKCGTTRLLLKNRQRHLRLHLQTLPSLAETHSCQS